MTTNTPLSLKRKERDTNMLFVIMIINQIVFSFLDFYARALLEEDYL